MGIVVIIVGGVVLTTLFATLFDYLGKRQKKTDVDLQNKFIQLEKRVSELDAKFLEKDEKIRQLESEISFVNKLLDDKTK